MSRNQQQPQPPPPPSPSPSFSSSSPSTSPTTSRKAAAWGKIKSKSSDVKAKAISKTSEKLISAQQGRVNSSHHNHHHHHQKTNSGSSSGRNSPTPSIFTGLSSVTRTATFPTTAYSPTSTTTPTSTTPTTTLEMSSIPFASTKASGAPTILARSPLAITSTHITSKLAIIWTGVLGAKSPQDGVSVSAWLSFLVDVQQEDATSETVLQAKALPQDDPNTLVGIDYLHHYLTRPSATLVKIPDPATRDASHPLTSYFISSSHNTYLVGHQLYGDSTTEGYINVLRRGCRCIEIDVWDGDDGEPQVFHGYTLTKEISFKEVCKAIRDHAFWEERDADTGVVGEVVDGPVIISLECHASHEQQKRMVEIMKKVWKGLLIEKPFGEGEDTVHDVKHVPTLAQLRGKILVKTKYLPRDPLATAAKEVAQPTTTGTKVDQGISDSDSDSELEELSRQNNAKKPPRAKLSRELADLAIYCGASHFPGTFAHPVSTRPTHVFSFSEKVFKSHSATMEAQIIAHNKQHFMRVYPFGLRFSSSNADPTLFWRRGVQLVALNWQKFDEGMMLNEAMFSGEGGYVLKPPHFRPDYTGPPPRERKLDLTIEIIAAQNLPLPSDDDKPEKFEPYVKVEVYLGNPRIEKGEEVKSRTRKAANRGVDCAWEDVGKKRKSRKLWRSGTSSHEVHDDDDEASHIPAPSTSTTSPTSPTTTTTPSSLANTLASSLHLHKRKYPKIGETIKFKGIPGVVEGAEMLGYVRFKVHDEEFGRDDLAAWACVRLDRLRQGYRFVRLLDREGRRTGGGGKKGGRKGEEGVLLVRVRWSVA